METPECFVETLWEEACPVCHGDLVELSQRSGSVLFCPHCWPARGGRRPNLEALRRWVLRLPWPGLSRLRPPLQAWEWERD